MWTSFPKAVLRASLAPQEAYLKARSADLRGLTFTEVYCPVGCTDEQPQVIGSRLAEARITPRGGKRDC